MCLLCYRSRIVDGSRVHDLQVHSCFIGGSPGGVAGGIKTTTFAIAMLNLRRILLGQKEVQFFQRRMDEIIASRAFAVSSRSRSARRPASAASASATSCASWLRASSPCSP